MGIRIKTKQFSPCGIKVEVKGEVDFFALPNFEDTVLGFVEEGFQEIVYDLRGLIVPELSVSRILRQAEQRAGETGGHITVIRDRLSLREILHMALFSKSLTFSRDLDEAVELAAKRAETPSHL